MDNRFKKKRIVSDKRRKQQSEFMKKHNRERESYLGELKNHPLYRVWTGIKNKNDSRGGCPPEWDRYKDFYKDVICYYEEGKFFTRKDSEKPLSKYNFEFSSSRKRNSENDIKISYNNISLGFRDWAKKLKVKESTLRCRYSKGYTDEEILFGKNKKKIKTSDKRKRQLLFNKRLSQYKIKDGKKGLRFDIPKEWMYKNCNKCVYCGNEDYKSLGLDRLDNSKGHTVDNVVTACYICNTTRGDRFSHDEMKIIGVVIRKIMKRR